MSPTKIVKICHTRNPELFAGLTRESVKRWIDRSGEQPKWSDAALKRVAAGNTPGHALGGPRGALVSILTMRHRVRMTYIPSQSGYPEVVDAIKARLTALRQAGVPLTTISTRGILIATIIRMAPEILKRKFHDGSTFRASDNFMRSWLHSAMGWSRRKATRAAQKLPENWEDQCEKAAMRIAYLIKEYDIPAELYANSDQTQRLYAPGDKLTYAETGAKQVSVIGGDEKRAFTVMVTVTSSGLLLPFQAIYMGKTIRSCPTSGPHYNDAIAAGFLFEPSGTKTYWSNQATMKSFVNTILAPYFDRMKAQLGRPTGQKSLWLIDVWSVHRSTEFLDWMHDNHPNILINFVPGGCTGVAQPCDVGMQRLFKHITNQAYLGDIVNETLTQIDTDSATVRVDQQIEHLRNASVGWLWKAYEGLNKPDIVQKVSTKNADNAGLNLLMYCLPGIPAVQDQKMGPVVRMLEVI